MWDNTISIDQISEIRCKTTAFLGVGAIAKINQIVSEYAGRGISKVVCITGRGSYKKTGAWNFVTEAFAKHGVEYILYDKVTPNPTADSVDEAFELASDFGAQAVFAIGGGSPIDAAKSVAILLKYPEKSARELYQLEFAPSEAAPIVAINLTHGTGTEVDRFAVVSIPEKEYKPAIAYDCIYPEYAIDDPALMTGLSPNQTRYVSVDAVNHVIEGATSLVATPYTILLAGETVRLVAKYLPMVLENPKDLKARYFLLYASMIGGICFDNGLLHYTHALEHPLSAMKPDLAHGLGLAMILPAVLAEIYGARPEVLATILAPIIPGLKGDPDESTDVAVRVEQWLVSVGIESKLQDEGFSADDISRLCDLAETTPSLDGLLSVAPVKASREIIERIYKSSLKPAAVK